MALRIGGPPAPAALPPEETLPPEEAAETAPDDEAAEGEAPKMKMSLQKLDPANVAYKTSDLGPFICSNCHYYDDDGSCSLVDGPIDPEGTCNLFTSMESAAPPEEAPPPAGGTLPIPPPAGGAPAGIPPELPPA